MDEDALLRAHAPKDAIVTAQPAMQSSPPAARRIKRAKTASAAVDGDFIEDMTWLSYQPQVMSPASANASSSASAYFVEKWALPRPAATPCAPSSADDAAADDATAASSSAASASASAAIASSSASTSASASASAATSSAAAIAAPAAFAAWDSLVPEHVVGRRRLAVVAALQRHANPQLLAKPPATYDAKQDILQRDAKGLVRCPHCLMGGFAHKGAVSNHIKQCTGCEEVCVASSPPRPYLVLVPWV